MSGRWTGRLPPPTRGSTLRGQRHQRFHFASPAHAGIDLRFRHCARSAGRFPRPRGDRPTTRRPRRMVTALPPPTRGSTHQALTLAAKASASPAHAGIDLRWIIDRPYRGRFPRPRGDRPFHSEGEMTAQELPPPTRGSTSMMARAAGMEPASPAHAGIDPHPLLPARVWPGFPRPRGDRPQAARDAAEIRELPPPTRGSTLRGQRHQRLHRASPAHAGIDPVERVC